MVIPGAPISFFEIPLPPSSNNQYRSFVKGGKITHVSSKELVAFKSAMERYFLSDMTFLKFAREKLSGSPLHFHTDFYFLRKRLFTKEGSFKRLDVSNRLKALHDCFAKALLIDDSYYVEISAKKYPVEDECLERVNVTIAPCDFSEKVF